MSKKLKSVDTAPEWYWVRGLHDAYITRTETYEFPFDYNKFSKAKGKTDRNAFVFYVNAKNALYDTEVKEIRLFNYKILSEKEFTVNDIIWWIGDSLTEENGSFVLEIEFYTNDFPELFTFKIKFERAEVDRD